MKKSNKTLWIFLLFLMLAMVLGFFRDDSNVDEIWNFTFANNIAMGLVPYRDFNLLQTPISCMINAVALLIFGRHLLVMRMMGALLFAGICVLLYKGSALLGAKGILRLAPSLSVLLLFDYNVFFEYSCLIIFCLLVMLYVDLWAVTTNNDVAHEYSRHTYNHLHIQVLTGLFAGVAVMSKQTFGGFVAAASWLAVIYVCRRHRCTGKETLRLVLARMVGTSIPCFFVLFYLLYHHAWDDFWDMSVSGIATFSSKSSFLTYMSLRTEYVLCACLFLMIFAAAIGRAWLVRQTEDGRRLNLILLYSLAGLINLVPLVNSYHLLTCLIPMFWAVVAVLCPLQTRRVVKWGSQLLLSAALVYILVYIPAIRLMNCRLETKRAHLEGIFFQTETYDAYEDTEKMIAAYLDEGRAVYLLANRAPWYLIPFDRYHKYLDMFLVGNLGTKTPTACLQDSLYENAVYLLPLELGSQYQYPKTDVESFRDMYLQYEGENATFTIWIPKA